MKEIFDRKLLEILEVRKNVKINPTIYVYIGPGTTEGIQQIRALANNSCPLVYVFQDPKNDQFYETAAKLPLTIPVKIDPDTVKRCILAVNCLKPSELMFTCDSTLELKEPAFSEQLNIVLKNTLSGLYHEKIGRLTDLRCALRNLPQIKACGKTKVKVESGSAVICGSGPSLQEQLNYLKTIRKNIYLIAIGKTGERLVREGINPDAIVFVDNLGHGLDWKNIFKTSGALLITFPTSAPEVAAYAQNIYFGRGPSIYFNQAMKNWETELPYLKYAGTGTVSGIDFAVKAGFDNICLIGNDMCVNNDGTSHISGYDDERKFIRSNMLSVPGIDGQPVTTNKEFDSLRQKLEQSLENVPVKIYNCTSHGAAITGTAPMPFEKFISSLATTPPKVHISCSKISIKASWSKHFDRCAADHAEHLFEDSVIPTEALDNYREYRSNWISTQAKRFVNDLKDDLSLQKIYEDIKYTSFRKYAVDFVRQSNPDFADWLRAPSPDAGKEFIFHCNLTECAFISLPRPDGQNIQLTASYVNTLEICKTEMKKFLTEKHFNPQTHGLVFVEPASWMHVVAMGQLFPQVETLVLLLWPELFSRLIDHCMLMHRIPSQTTIIACNDQFKNWRRLYHKTVRDWKRNSKEPLFFDNPYASSLPEFKSLYDQLPS